MTPGYACVLGYSLKDGQIECLAARESNGGEVALTHAPDRPRLLNETVTILVGRRATATDVPDRSAGARSRVVYMLKHRRVVIRARADRPCRGQFPASDNN